MRLTCPNCGAQYAVDPAVIPQDGRDVQCSSCGNTWFQQPPELALEEEEPAAEEMLPRRPPDPEAMRILREEAARERAARATDRAPLESQQELDIPAPPMPSAQPQGGSDDPAESPARETPPVSPISDAERGRRAAPRRSLLPDIEEINSAIASSPDHGDDPSPVATAQRRAREARSARMGFGIAVGIFAILTILYAQGPRIASAVPAFAPAFDAYVGVIDTGRLWLDGALRAAVAPSADPDQSTASEG